MRFVDDDRTSHGSCVLGRDSVLFSVGHLIVGSLPMTHCVPSAESTFHM